MFCLLLIWILTALEVDLKNIGLGSDPMGWDEMEFLEERKWMSDSIRELGYLVLPFGGENIRRRRGGGQDISIYARYEMQMPYFIEDIYTMGTLNLIGAWTGTNEMIGR